MKNYFGAIHNPNKYHDAHCDPHVAEVFDAPPVRSRHRLTVLDALLVQFHKGPAYHPQWAGEVRRPRLQPRSRGGGRRRLEDRRAAPGGRRPAHPPGRRARPGVSRDGRKDGHRPGRPGRRSKRSRRRWHEPAQLPPRRGRGRTRPGRGPAVGRPRPARPGRQAEPLPRRGPLLRQAPRPRDRMPALPEAVPARRQGTGLLRRPGERRRHLLHPRLRQGLQPQRRPDREEAVLSRPARHVGPVPGHGRLQRELQVLSELGDLPGPAGTGRGLRPLARRGRRPRPPERAAPRSPTPIPSRPSSTSTCSTRPSGPRAGASGASS